MPAFAPALLPGTGPVYTLPVLSTGITATAGAANTYGAYVQLAAAGLVTADLRVVGISIDTPSGALLGKVEIVYDEAGTPVSLCEVDLEVVTDAGVFFTIPVPFGGLVPAGETIGARHKSVAGGTTVNIHVAVMEA